MYSCAPETITVSQVFPCVTCDVLRGSANYFTAQKCWLSSVSHGTLVMFIIDTHEIAHVQ